VVRVFVPGLIGNFCAAFPYQGKGRLRDAAVELGWRSAPLAEEEINVFPLPHA
jgi:ribosomal protein S12 methylthiotransferase accessory factor